MNKEKYQKIYEECLNELYLNSEPPISWKDYRIRYWNTKTQGFLNHYLPEDKCEKIMKKYRKRLPEYDSLAWLILDLGPTSNKENLK